MKKEPSKTQENGISDTGIPMPDDILLRLVKEKDAGKEYMAAIREKLMRLLKEYLGQKYGRKVRFILPTGDPAGDLLDGILSLFGDHIRQVRFCSLQQCRIGRADCGRKNPHPYRRGRKNPRRGRVPLK